MGRAGSGYLVAKRYKEAPVPRSSLLRVHTAAVQVLVLSALRTFASCEGGRCQGHPRRPGPRAGFAFRGCSG